MKLTSLILPALAGLAALSSPGRAGPAIDLGSAATYGVLAGTSITSTGSTVVHGDLGVSPGVTISGFTGFGGGGDGIVERTIHAGDSSAGTAQADMFATYNLLSGQTATVTGVTSFANTTVTPGVYNSTASLSIIGSVVLSGNGVFVFQMGSTLLTDPGSQVSLTNGALAQNVYWQVGSSATLGGSSTLVGTVLANTSISAGADAIIDGRLLAHSGAVTLAGNSITAIPEPATSALAMAGFAGLLIGWRKFGQRRTAALRQAPGAAV